MNSEEWKDWYNQSLKDWKEGYKKALEEWRGKFRDWSGRVKLRIPDGSGQIIPNIPAMPPIPMPTIHVVPPGRSNVVASRISDNDLRLIDMLTEAGLFNTRSEAVAYLVAEGIKARKDIFDKVSSSLEEIRKIRQEAEDHIKRLRKETGVAESEEIEGIEEIEKRCQKCGRDLSDLPENIAICPYCGTKLKSQ